MSTAADAVHAAQKRVAQRAAQFERETDPVRKARAFADYGDELLKLLREQLRAEQFDDALETLQLFQQGAVTAHKGLKESGINAERRSNGFRQMEILLRRSLRQIDEFSRVAPLDDRDRYAEVRRDVQQMNSELIQMLFPRGPGKRPQGNRP